MMSAYQPYINAIISNLWCSVPLALLFIWTFGRDIYEVISRQLNPELPYLHWKDVVAPPEKLQSAHDDLLRLGFTELGIYERTTLFKRLQYWCYCHPDNPIIFVSMTEDNGDALVQFFTVFDDNEVINTVIGKFVQIDTPDVIIKTVTGSVPDAYESHQMMVDSEMARFGVPFEVTSIVDFTDMLKRAKNTHLTAIFRAYYVNSRGAMFAYWVLSALFGIVALSLIYLRQLSLSQAMAVSNIITGLTIIGIGVTIVFFIFINQSAVQAKRKANKLKN